MGNGLHQTLSESEGKLRRGGKLRTDGRSQMAEVRSQPPLPRLRRAKEIRSQTLRVTSLRRETTARQGHSPLHQFMHRSLLRQSSIRLRRPGAAYDGVCIRASYQSIVNEGRTAHLFADLTEEDRIAVCRSTGVSLTARSETDNRAARSKARYRIGRRKV